MDHGSGNTRDREHVVPPTEERRAINQSPWAIGVAHYDQRDLYTRNASTDDDGYGVGPSYHPEEGSYAYRRSWNDHEPTVVREGDANLYEREAWPWLNYTDQDPYFAYLDDGSTAEPEHGVWQRLKEGVRSVLHLAPATNVAEQRSDARITADVADALNERRDLDATDIEVTTHEGEVVLEGTVPDRASKRLAKDVAAEVRGVRRVVNHLEIREDPRDMNPVFAFSSATFA